MHRLIVSVLLYVSVASSAHAADSPFVGTWKVTALPPGSDVVLWLLQISEKDGQLQATVIAPQASGCTVTHAKTDDQMLRLGIKTPYLTYSFAGYLPKDALRPQLLLGSLEARGRRDMVRLERTDLKELPPGGVVTPAAAAEELAKADRLRGAQERELAFRNLAAKFPGQSVAFHAALELVALAAEEGAPGLELRSRADAAVKAAAPYGREMELQALVHVARQFARGEKQGPLALDYSRRAQKLMTEDDPPAVQTRVLRTLALAMRRTGQGAAAQPLDARAEHLDEALDREFEQTSLPFSPPARPQSATPNRLVAVELFTSSTCPFCVAADLACVGIEKTFGSNGVAILSYHLPAPMPDPLANHDSEGRARFYNVQATSALLLNGKIGPIVGGSIIEVKDRYDSLFKAITAQSESTTLIKLKVSAIRRGDKIDVATEASELPVSDSLRLRLVLAEEKVRYPGPNGQRLNYHVVRALLGGVDGTPLRSKSIRQTTTVSVQALDKSLRDYLDELGRIHKFLDDERPLELKRLKVVALVQDDKTKEILQAAQAAVPEK